MRQYIKEIGTHSTVYAVSNILTKSIGIILIPIYTRFLTVEDYGIIAIVAPVVNAFLIFYTFGMRATYGRFFFDNKDRSPKQKEILGMAFVFVLLLGITGNTLLTFFGRPFFDRLFPGIDFYPYIILGIWTGFFLLTFDMKLNVFRLRQQSLYYGIFSLVKFGLIVALTIYMVVSLRMGALGKIMAEFIVCAVFFLLALVLLVKDIALRFDGRKFREMIRYALGVLPHNVAGVILGLTPKYFLNIHIGVEAAGLYNIAFLIGSVMNIVITSVNLSWNPFFMKTATTKDRDESDRIFSQLTTYYAMAMIFIGLGIAFFSKEAIMVLTTAEYFDAASIAPLLVFAYVIQGGYYMVVTKIFYVKKATSTLAIISVSSTVVSIILNALLVPSYGLEGSAWSFLITAIFMFILTSVISQRIYPIRYENLRLVKLLIIATCCVAGFYAVSLTDPGLFTSVALKLGILILYPGLLIAFRMIKRSEVANLKDIFRKVMIRYRIRKTR